MSFNRNIFRYPEYLMKSKKTMIFNCSCNKKDCLSNTYLLFQVEGHQGQTHTHTHSHIECFPSLSLA